MQCAYDDVAAVSPDEERRLGSSCALIFRADFPAQGKATRLPPQGAPSDDAVDLHLRKAFSHAKRAEFTQATAELALADAKASSTDYAFDVNDFFVLHNIGVAFALSGLAQKGQPMLQRAFKGIVAALGPADPRTMQAATALVNAEAESGIDGI